MYLANVSLYLIGGNNNCIDTLMYKTCLLEKNIVAKRIVYTNTFLPHV